MRDFLPASGSSAASRLALGIAVAVLLLVAGCNSMQTGNSGASSDEQSGFGRRGGMDGGTVNGGHTMPDL